MSYSTFATIALAFMAGFATPHVWNFITWWWPKEQARKEHDCP